MNQNPVTSNGARDPNEFPWAEIFAFIGRHIYSIFGCGIVGLIIGIVAAEVVPKQWEATSLLQVGQIQYSSDSVPVLVEPLAQIEARVESRPFIDDVLRAEGQDPRDNSAPLNKLVRKTLTAKLIPGSNLIALTVRGLSENQAKQILRTIDKMLIESHAKIVEPFIFHNREKLAHIQADLAATDARSKQLNTAAASAAATAIDAARRTSTSRQSNNVAGASNDVMLLGLLEKNAEAQRSLLDLRDSVEQRLDPARTFVTLAVGRVSTPDRAAYPKLGEFAIVGLLVGVGIGLAFAALLHQRHKYL
jgi:hypothetical protein